MGKAGKPGEVGSRLDVLDGWRAVSIALVIIAHITQQSSIALPLGSMGPAGAFLEVLGTLGVNIFFVLSGFVICRGLLHEESRHGRISLRAFYVRRTVRVIPPLALYLATIWALGGAGVVGDIESLPRAFSFTCNLSGADCGGYLGAHTWSLSVEEQFYLVAPALFVLAVARRQAGALSAFIILASLSLWLLIAGDPGAAHTLAMFLPISAGVVCALFERRIRALLDTVPGALLLLTPIVVLLLERMMITRFWLVGAILVGPAIAIMLLTPWSKASLRVRLLAAPPMVAVGRVSYGIYLWQQLATYPFAGAGVGFYLVSVTACIALAFLLFHLMERPLIAVARRWSEDLIARQRHVETPTAPSPA